MTSDAQKVWADQQRALARALGLSLEDWIGALEAASRRKTGLTAAVIGAAMGRGLGMGVLDRLDPPALVRTARQLIDPAPPERIENPVLKEAVRRAAELGAGKGKKLLAKRPEVSTPIRGTAPIGRSAKTATPDAPGEDE